MFLVSGIYGKGIENQDDEGPLAFANETRVAIARCGLSGKVHQLF